LQGCNSYAKNLQNASKSVKAATQTRDYRFKAELRKSGIRQRADSRNGKP